MEELVEFILPKNFFNIGVGIIDKKQYLVGDTNDSNNWDEFKIPLPNIGTWSIFKNDSSKLIVLKLIQ